MVNKTQYNMKTETPLRIGAPDEQLIEQRASLLEQLEIEAELEENIKQQMKSESSLNNPNVNSAPIKTRSSDESGSVKDFFISQIKREPNETSRPSQTVKTSLGKKSKPREKNSENEFQANSTFNNEEEVEELSQNIQITSENDAVITRASTSKSQETPPSDDDRKDY